MTVTSFAKYRQRSVLLSTCCWYILSRRGSVGTVIRAGMWIRKTNNINRDDGSYQISHVWGELLTDVKNRTQARSTYGRGGGEITPKPRPCPQMWHKHCLTNSKNQHIYRCKKGVLWPSKYAKMHFRSGLLTPHSTRFSHLCARPLILRFLGSNAPEYCCLRRCLLGRQSWWGPQPARDSGTVYLSTSSLPHHSQHFVIN